MKGNATHGRFDAKTAVLLLVSVLIGFALLEFGARVWLAHAAPEHLFARYGTQAMIAEQPLRFSRHPYLSFFPTPGYTNEKGNRHNALGYRGDEIVQPKPADTYRIVAVGGSTTYTDGVKDYTKSYPYLLQEELRERGFANVEVVNGGVPFYDSWSTLINFQFRVLDLAPDMVIYYEGDNEQKTRMVFPHEAYQGDNTGRIAPPPTPTTGLLDRSVALRMLVSRVTDIAHFGDLTRLHSAPTLVHFDYLEQVFGGTYPQGVFEERGALDILEDNPPIYTRRNLENLAAIANEQGVDVVFATYAYAPLEGERTATPVYRQAITEHNAVVQEVAEQKGALLYDFAKEMSTDPQYWIRDGVHVNEEGSALKAELFADFLTPRLLGRTHK